MSLTQIFKRIIVPCAAGATQVSEPEGHTYGVNCAKNPNAQQGTKPSDLPLYTKECSVCRESNQTSPPPSGMEETVGNIRRELWVWQDNLKGYRHKIVDVYRRGFSKAESLIDYLREPPHGPYRMGAIALSGVTGYIMGMRRGMCRRFFYSATGMLGMAYVCYPEGTKDYVESVVLEGRKCFIVAYHFVCGETPKTPEWLEKFIGPAGPKEGEPKTIQANLESEKAIPSEEEPEKKKKKT